MEEGITDYMKVNRSCESTKNSCKEFLEYLGKQENVIKKECADINASLDKLIGQIDDEFEEDKSAEATYQLRKDEEKEEDESVYEFPPEEPNLNATLSISVEEAPKISIKHAEASEYNESPRDPFSGGQRLSIIEPKEQTGISTDMNAICQTLNIQTEENMIPILEMKEKDETQLISFGEPCFIHKAKERNKMWLLLGEKGEIKISDSQEFTNCSSYKLKNVIKLTYADVQFFPL